MRFFRTPRTAEERAKQYDAELTRDIAAINDQIDFNSETIGQLSLENGRLEGRRNQLAKLKVNLSGVLV